MAKLHFKYGAMNSGKTTILIQTAYNYEERDQKVIILKPSIDTKGDNYIVSRIGAKRKIDEFIKENDKIIDIVEKHLNGLKCILVDEAQFLKKEQVDELFYISKKHDVPVIAYGLRTDFKMQSFEGSQRLLEIADELEEMPTICRCGKKARFNARIIDGKFVTEGDSVVIDNKNDVKYESLCGKCYLKNVKGVL